MDTFTEERAESRGRRSLRKHGSTFHAAHLILGRGAAEHVHLLYGFCRYVDDVVDEQSADRARWELDLVRSELRLRDSDEPHVAGYLRFCELHDVDPRVTEEFLAGVQQDLDTTSYADEAELLRYCFRVAGTVGLLMCSLFDVEDRRAHPFAVDLGIGMQLTNICRDVIEDARRGRVYLPAESTGGALDAAKLARRDPEEVFRARRGVERLLGLAAGYYRSADHGMDFLPRRARLAVLTASRCYEAIGPRILAHSRVELPDRAYVGSAGKAWHLARATSSALRVEARRLAARRRVHRPELHGALAGLPGVDPALR